MKKAVNTFDSPQQMAAYLTDNPHLQDFFETFLSIKNLDERKDFEIRFWAYVTQLPAIEQVRIRAANTKITQRLYDRMGSVIIEIHQAIAKNEALKKGQ